MEPKEKASDEKSLGSQVRDVKEEVEKEIHKMLGKVYKEKGITITGITIHCHKPIFGNSIESRAFQVEVTLEF